MPLVSPLKVESTLSVIWTHERLVSEVRTATNELDNERVQDSNIRNHINVCLSNIAELLNLAKNPIYGISWQATPDYTGVGFPPAGKPPIPFIDLTIPCSLEVNNQPWTTTLPTTSQFTPYSLLWEINRLGYGYQDPLGNSYSMHNCQKLSQEEIMHLNTGSNMQATQHISWNHHGGSIYLWIGQEVIAPNEFWIFGYRNPIMDDLKDYATSVTWRKPIDLSDRYIRLLLLMSQKMVLEQVNKQIDPAMEQNIQSMTAQITSQIVQETQFAEAQRVKQEYGLKTR
jgi:hypothetical protein